MASPSTSTAVADQHARATFTAAAWLAALLVCTVVSRAHRSHHVKVQAHRPLLKPMPDGNSHPRHSTEVV